MTPGPLLLLALVALMTSVAIGGRYPRTWLALTGAGTVAGLGAALSALLGGDWEWRGGLMIGGEALHLRLDGLSGLFMALLAVVGGAGAVYAREYWADAHYPESAPRGRAWWSALVLSMGLVLTVSNGLHFLIAWELFAVCGYFLITLDGERGEARTAGWVYLAASHAGTLCLFGFFTSLASHNGNWDLGPMREHIEVAPLFWLALVGFGMKAGFFPLHIWLPSAHANAPSHVSAIMSGVAIKMGLYGIVRFSGWLPTPVAAGWVVMALGGTSALAGMAFAFAQNDFKRMLAYCSVENMGIMLIGVGGAMLAVSHGEAGWGRLVMAGALLHVWNHGLVKALLFLGSGSVLHATGTREMSRLGGLWRAMPWTAGMFGMGAVAICGLPPLNGFVSEWLVYLGMMDAAAGKGHAAWATMPAMILMATAGAVALACFVKACAMIFLGAPRTQQAARAHECGVWMRGPMLGLAGLCVAIAIAPMVFWPAIARAVGSWHPAWGEIQAPGSLGRLGAMQVVLVMLFAAAGAGLWAKVRGNGLRRGLTWDCAYEAPTARMQYTGGSFAGIVAGWFEWALCPERKLRRPRGIFPVEAIRLERVPEMVLERIIGPVGVAVMLVSTGVRRLQHGRLQFYILYVVGALIALGVLVSMGGAR